jgi:catechol 2,3-dioxygenase-like lactoylglutathione lyase family enzyme
MMEATAARIILGIDNIGLAVQDFARSGAFCEKLGFLRTFENERGCSMTVGSAKLSLLFKAVPGVPAHRPFTLEKNPPGIDHISFVVDDVDRTDAEIQSRGVFLWPLQRIRSGELEPLFCEIPMGIISIF